MRRPATPGGNRFLNLAAKTYGDVAVVAIPGPYIDAATADDFVKAMAPFLDAHRKLILDLNQLRFLDSSGLRAIIQCLRRTQAAGGALQFCGMDQRVRATFELTGMFVLLDVSPTLEDAIRAFTA